MAKGGIAIYGGKQLATDRKITLIVPGMWHWNLSKGRFNGNQKLYDHRKYHLPLRGSPETWL